MIRDRLAPSNSSKQKFRELTSFVLLARDAPKPCYYVEFSGILISPNAMLQIYTSKMYVR